MAGPVGRWGAGGLPPLPPPGPGLGPPFDLTAPVIPAAQAVVRVGCPMAGCCHGRITSGWPALYLPSEYRIWAWRYPTQVADILANALIALARLGWERGAVRRARQPSVWPFPGFLFCVILYCAQPFVFEFWRGGTPCWLAPSPGTLSTAPSAWRWRDEQWPEARSPRPFGAGQPGRPRDRALACVGQDAPPQVCYNPSARPTRRRNAP
ncbi:MAG: prolipoprotein diacylglyceryl transferase [Chloroflexi bacterium]|nr:prolipoprotein diacylglyceryl transferase [Chloroflexota bacterium]